MIWTKHDKGAPTPSGVIAHFMATVADYDRLEAAYPLDNSINVIRGHGEDEQRRWLVVLHVAVLRKYYAQNDAVCLSQVIQAIRACVIPICNVTDDQWDETAAAVWRPASTIKFHIGDQPPRGEGDLLRDELYGRYLHGEFKKWQNASSRPLRINDNAVHSATVLQAFQLQAVARLVRTLTEDGFLIL